MTLLYGLIIAGLAALTVGSRKKGAKQLFWVLKPLTMLVILPLAFIGAPRFPSPYQGFVVAGLLLSLAGDILLMLDDRWFLAGLVAFLLAHISYIGAFSSVLGFAFRLAPLAAALVLAGVIVSQIWAGLGKMRLPVVAYVLVIATMFWQASGLWLELRTPAAAYAAAGATLFLISDGVLALDRFGASFESAPVIVLGTYYAAQTLLALSV